MRSAAATGLGPQGFRIFDRPEQTRRRRAQAAAEILGSRINRGRLEKSMAAEDQVLGLGRWDGEVTHTSPVIRYHAPTGKPFDWVFEEMEYKDPELSGLLERVYDAVLALQRTIQPADGTPGAREAAELCRDALAQIPEWGTMLRRLAEAIADGVAFVEVNWGERTEGPFSGAWVPVHMEPRPMRAFGFKVDTNFLNRLHVRSSAELVPAPPGKFLVNRRGTSGGPWGYGLKNRLYWWWKAKQYGIQDWQHLLERFSKPISGVEFETLPEGEEDAETKNAERKAEALALAQGMHGDGAIAWAKGVYKPELMTAQLSGNASHGEFSRAMTQGMARLLLGEVNTMGLRPGVGAYASEQVSVTLSGQKVGLAGHDLGTIVKDQLLRPITALNLPGAPAPRFDIDTRSIADAEILMEGVREALKEGFPVPVSHLRRAWRIPQTEPQEEEFKGASG